MTLVPDYDNFDSGFEKRNFTQVSPCIYVCMYLLNVLQCTIADVP